MKVESTAQARELPEKEPETFAQLTSNERQILQWRNEFLGQSDFMTIPFALLTILWGYGGLEIILEAEVCEKYMEIGVYSVIFVNEEYFYNHLVSL